MLIKKILLNLLLVVFLLGCSDKNVELTIEKVSKINGRITDWDSSVNDSLFWNIQMNSTNYCFVSTKISNEGKFHLELPIPPTEILKGYNKPKYEETKYFKITEDIKFSDSTSKYVLLFLSHLVTQSATIPIQCGNIKNFYNASNVGDYQRHYYYFDKPTIVEGSYKVELLDNAYYSWKERNIITKYCNIHFERGWNQVTIELISIAKDTRVLEIKKTYYTSTDWQLLPLVSKFIRIL